MSRLFFFFVGIAIGHHLTNKYDFNRLCKTGKKEILSDPEIQQFINKMKKIEKQMQRQNKFNDQEDD